MVVLRNFIVNNQMVMNKIKSFNQVLSIGADVPNHTTKIVNKFGSQDCILYKLKEFSSSVQDFRRLHKGNIRHRLDDIIMLMILARTSKCVGRTEIIEFGKHNLSKFRKLGMLKNGVPSEATLCRVEHGIDDQALADRMQEFAKFFHGKLYRPDGDREIICVDGKAERGTVQDSGRNPDIVSAYSYNAGITLATEACSEKSNEIKAVPRLVDKINISGKVVTADAMSMQKDIIEKIRENGGDFLIELKANQPSLRYVVEDKLKERTPVYSYTEGPELRHGRIESRTYRIFDGLDIIADKEKWGGNMTIVEYESETVKKSSGQQTSEKRLYVSSLPSNTPTLGSIGAQPLVNRKHALGAGCQFAANRIKRKSAKAARNLDTIQRVVHSLFSIWKRLRKKQSDKSKGIAEFMRNLSKSFTRLLRFLH